MSNRRPQKPKAKLSDIAKQRGIYAVRRPIAPESREVFDVVESTLSPYLEGGGGRIFTENTLGVTVIGASLFSENHYLKGPATCGVLERIPSAKENIATVIGSLALFGGGKNLNKLGFELTSPELIQENALLHGVYSDLGFPLRSTRFAGSSYNSHCSIAILYSDQIGRFDNPDILRKLDRTIAIEGKEIMLSPPTINLDDKF